MDVARAEGLAVELYERLGFDPREPISPFRLARTWLGADAVIRPVSFMSSPAMTFVLNGQRRIALKKSVSPAYAGFYVGHELGHVLLEEAGYRGEFVEEMADMIGAALLAPLPAVRSLIDAFGRTAFEAVADEVGATETWAALRIAEALGIPRAILTPARVYVRGPEEFLWGPEDSLRQLARGRSRPGITRIRLHDDPRRYVIDVEETA